MSSATHITVSQSAFKAGESIEVSPNDQNVFNELKFVKSRYKKAIIHAICRDSIDCCVIVSPKVTGSLNILIKPSN